MLVVAGDRDGRRRPGDLAADAHDVEPPLRAPLHDAGVVPRAGHQQQAVAGPLGQVDVDVQPVAGLAPVGDDPRRLAQHQRRLQRGADPLGRRRRPHARAALGQVGQRRQPLRPPGDQVGRRLGRPANGVAARAGRQQQHRQRAGVRAARDPALLRPGEHRHDHVGAARQLAVVAVGDGDHGRDAGVPGHRLDGLLGAARRRDDERQRVAGRRLRRAGRRQLDVRVVAAGAEQRGRRVRCVGRRPHPDQQHPPAVDRGQAPGPVGVGHPHQRLRLGEDVRLEPLDVHDGCSSSQRMPPVATCVHSGRNVAA